jgi:hypothetical protein
MVKVDLKGIAKVTAKGRVYRYAWRGGPRLRGEPGSPDFMASYNEAIRERHIPEPGKFRALVTLYRASPDYQSSRHRPNAIGRDGSTRLPVISARSRLPNSSGRKRLGQSSDNGATVGPKSRALPTSLSKSYRVCCRMGLTRSARSPGIRAKESNCSIRATVPRSSGLMVTLPVSRKCAASRLPTQLILMLLPAYVSAIYYACPGRTFRTTRSPSARASPTIVGRRSSHSTTVCATCWRASRSVPPRC